VLSSVFAQFLDPQARLLKRSDGENFRVVAATAAEAIAGIRTTVDAIRALGKQVVVVAPPPMGGFDVGRCVERFESKSILIGALHECRISLDDYRKEMGDVLAFLAALPDQAQCQRHWV